MGLMRIVLPSRGVSCPHEWTPLLAALQAPYALGLFIDFGFLSCRPKFAELHRNHLYNRHHLIAQGASCAYSQQLSVDFPIDSFRALWTLADGLTTTSMSISFL